MSSGSDGIQLEELGADHQTDGYADNALLKDGVFDMGFMVYVASLNIIL